MSKKISKPINEGNNANLLLSAVSLAELSIKILDEKAHRGCDNKVWFGFQNGNGEEVGKDLNELSLKRRNLFLIAANEIQGCTVRIKITKP